MWMKAENILHKQSLIADVCPHYHATLCYIWSTIFCSEHNNGKDTWNTSHDELKLRTVAAIETVTPQMLENTWYMEGN
jgi:hypothetical protein